MSTMSIGQQLENQEFARWDQAGKEASNADAYLTANPDVNAAYNAAVAAGTATSDQTGKTNFAADHYKTFGLSEGRTWGAASSPTTTQAPVTTQAPIAATVTAPPVTAPPLQYSSMQDDSVESRLKGLLDPSSPLIQQAKTSAAQAANARGLQNSTMAVQAGEVAADNAALPIASQDAAQTAAKNLSLQGYEQGANLQGQSLNAQQQMQGAALSDSDKQQLITIAAQQGIQAAQIASTEKIATQNIDAQKFMQAQSLAVQQAMQQAAISDSDKQQLASILAQKDIQGAALSDSDKQQLITIAAQQGIQAAQIASNEKIAANDESTKLGLANLDIASQQHIADQNIASHNQQIVSAQAAQIQQIYEDQIKSISNNPDIPADVRDRYLADAAQSAKQNMDLLSSIYSVQLDWSPPTFGTGASTTAGGTSTSAAAAAPGADAAAANTTFSALANQDTIAPGLAPAATQATGLLPASAATPAVSAVANTTVQQASTNGSNYGGTQPPGFTSTPQVKGLIDTTPTSFAPGGMVTNSQPAYQQEVAAISQQQQSLVTQAFQNMSAGNYSDGTQAWVPTLTPDQIAAQNAFVTQHDTGSSEVTYGGANNLTRLSPTGTITGTDGKTYYQGSDGFIRELSMAPFDPTQGNEDNAILSHWMSQDPVFGEGGTMPLTGTQTGLSPTNDLQRRISMARANAGGEDPGNIGITLEDYSRKPVVGAQPTPGSDPVKNGNAVPDGTDVSTDQAQELVQNRAGSLLGLVSSVPSGAADPNSSDYQAGAKTFLKLIGGPATASGLTNYAGQLGPVATVVGALSGIMGLGTLLSAGLTAADINNANDALEKAGVRDTLGFWAGLKDMAYHTTLGLIGQNTLKQAADAVLNDGQFGETEEQENERLAILSDQLRANPGKDFGIADSGPQGGFDNGGSGGFGGNGGDGFA